MGRITIFTTSGCKHCVRVKSALASRDIRFAEISLSSYPERWRDMLALSDKLNVPQVFFNERYVGGADETVSLLHKWEKEKKYPTVMDRFRAEVESAPGPTDSRLAIPVAPVEEPSSRPLPREETRCGSIELPCGKDTSFLKLTCQLVHIMPRADLNWRTRVYKDCFKGRDGVTALMRRFNISHREEAITFGRTLQRKQLLDHVCGDHVFGDNGYYYRLQPFHRPHVLNSFRVWTDRVSRDVMGLMRTLRQLLNKIVAAVTDENGLVDYVAAKKQPLYYVFEERVCSLQAINMGIMEEELKRAFAINTYNLMITHAFIKVGPASTSTQRSAFYGSICYDIGGDELSFDELEHGVLRANSRPPYSLATPFATDDSRFRLSLIRLDPRIHFALNCGAKSCPPVNNFTADSIEEELRIVAQAFCEGDENVSIDEANCVLLLSMLFYWYRPDFADTAKLPNVIATYLQGEKRKRLCRMIRSGRQITIKYFPYDWTINASRSESFDASRLDPNQIRFKSLFVRSSAPEATTDRQLSLPKMASFQQSGLSGSLNAISPHTQHTSSASLDSSAHSMTKVSSKTSEKPARRRSSATSDGSSSRSSRSVTDKSSPPMATTTPVSPVRIGRPDSNSPRKNVTIHRHSSSMSDASSTHSKPNATVRSIASRASGTSVQPKTDGTPDGAMSFIEFAAPEDAWLRGSGQRRNISMVSSGGSAGGSTSGSAITESHSNVSPRAH